MRAIDLYSGVGGWSLGLALAGIEVVESYEHFEAANETNRRNNQHSAIKADIRVMPLANLPSGIDLVVGSPPCTQFSYSNRGGGGDLDDGLKDITRFLAIIDHLKPKFWVMENVPRVAEILEKEFADGGQLAAFSHLKPTIKVFNMEAWGLPQRRKRCIAGNIDFGLLEEYVATTRRRTLGDVVTALASDVVVDPIYGITLTADKLIDHVLETPLNDEEVRVNRAAKTAHTVYNAMPFPDPLDRSVRTITATCTRVSRESVVIADTVTSGFRRLTLRERASLQGFPITFQFYATSHGRKAKMIGNAVPPLFSYFVGSACLKVPLDRIPLPSTAISSFNPPKEQPPVTKADLAGHRYAEDRTFRFAVPGFNFKSGVRFEMSNKRRPEIPGWHISFYFGHSKDIRSLQLDRQVLKAVLDSLPDDAESLLAKHIDELNQVVVHADVKRMQDVWTRKGPGGTRPFDLLDEVGRIGSYIAKALSTLPQERIAKSLTNALRSEYGEKTSKLPGLAKLERLAPSIVAGFVAGAVVNCALEPSIQPVPSLGGKRAVAV